MKVSIKTPDWQTNAVAVICDSCNKYETYLFSYSTLICKISYTTKTDKARITFNDKPYQASVTTSKHLRWFLDWFLSKNQREELMKATQARSLRQLMINNVDYVFKHDA